VSRLLAGLAYVLLLAAGSCIALGILRLDKTVVSLLTGVGILGLTLGFALQDVAANIIAGLLIELQHPFHVGDVIETSSFLGQVRRITLRATELLLVSGQTVWIPNKEVFNKPVVNHSASPARCIDLELPVSSRDDLRQVMTVAGAAMAEVGSRIPSRDVQLFFKAIGDNSVTLMIRFWIGSSDETDYLRARSEAILRVKEAFNAHHLAQLAA